MLKKVIINFQPHPFHLVSPSPWPLYTSISLFCLTNSLVWYMHNFLYANVVFILSILILILSASFWFRDIIFEGTYLGDHTLAVQNGLVLGITLFIISEILFFVSIFWTYFHSSLSPTIDIGAIWPPIGIETINAFELPLLNTVLLLSSGVSVTYSHHCLINGNRNGALYSLVITIVLAILFTQYQVIEYVFSSFTITDSVFGSCFYFGTGFHGLHVLIGTFFLGVGFLRLFWYHLSTNHHLGLEFSILYWHFVDVVWLILFVFYYYLGS